MTEDRGKATDGENEGHGRAAIPRRSQRRTRAYKSRDERRAEIVEATLAILVEEGLHAWTTSALAERVGVSEATLFRHFEDKDEILTEALRHQTRTLQERIAGYQVTGTAWTQLEGLIVHVLDFIEETGGGPRLILSGQALRMSPESREEVESTRRAFHGRLTALFRQVLEDSKASPAGPEPEALADLAVAIVHSSALRWMVEGQRRPAREVARPMLNVLRRCLPGEKEER